MRIKRWIGFAAAAAGAALLLSACTSSGEKTGETAGETVSEESSGSVSSDEGADAPAQETDAQTGTVVQTEMNAQTGTVVQTEMNAQTGATVQTETNAQTEAAAQTETNAQTETAAQTETQDVSREDLWSGTYVSDDETLTVTQTDDSTLSIAFANSGITGTAQIDGMQAVYKGDDYHDVVLNLTGDVIDVTVSSEEDYDSSQSPLIGSYVMEE